MPTLTVTACADNFVGVRVANGTADEAARLITAAPDILAILQALVAEADLGEIDHDENTRMLLACARATIAAATGRLRCSPC